MEKKEPPKKKRVLVVMGKNTEICAHCGKPFEDSDYARLSRLIVKQKPVCSYECNKALGQVK